MNDPKILVCMPKSKRRSQLVAALAKRYPDIVAVNQSNSVRRAVHHDRNVLVLSSSPGTSADCLLSCRSHIDAASIVLGKEFSMVEYRKLRALGASVIVAEDIDPERIVDILPFLPGHVMINDHIILSRISLEEVRENGRVTDRELEVAKLWHGGYSSRAIALVLGISENTLDVHKANIARKLNVHSRSELIAAYRARYPDPIVDDD